MFLALVSIVFAYISYTFNFHFYQHSDVVSMGQPETSINTETQVLYHAQTIMSTAL